MAIAIAVTVIFGFTLNAARMNWTFLELPLQVHLHAAAFLAWIILYVVQNWLVVWGSITWHRQLGVLGAVIAASMVVLGIAPPSQRFSSTASRRSFRLGSSSC
ncbi:hypothetical protein ASE82_15905 [Sphingomonas sp. Leaf230]|uniref:hypothetical protein n=1 Tax=Sphingomonas sp. Leaf230 TaxID=1735694 RepID=UPI0006FB1C27|nr:hypothetical protein [Sphingomonas sp. Leaf230]KQN01362.1 hypothetical protein ASE82_15905 [Sphingomonas sp. Leaf230]